MRLLAVQLSESFPSKDVDASDLQPLLRFVDSDSARAILKFRRVEDAQSQS
jgi:hypothetical protein